MAQPILQFGTGRFLQAHVDLFVSQALTEGQALGGITVVQTTASPSSAARLAALSTGQAFPVRVRGIAQGQVVDEQRLVGSVREGLQAQSQWQALLDRALQAEVMVSNTADTGFALSPLDEPPDLLRSRRAPASFPAKLLALLFHRWREAGPAALTLLPTELVARNGDTLRSLVTGLARQARAPDGFIDYLEHGCVWVNSLVDRIVSEPLHPVGAVTEPYALWAVERRAGMKLPCTHPAIVVTDDLLAHERLKLFILNLGHTWLAERWLRQGAPTPPPTVLACMQDPPVRDGLEQVWAEEVMPVFGALGLRGRALQYLGTVRDRFANPFLKHSLADIAADHAAKKLRRIGALIALADELGVPPHQHRLRGLLSA